MKAMLLSNGLELIPMTSELYHKEMMHYVADPMMCETPYVYTKEYAQRVFERKIAHKNRRWFAIAKHTIVIGDVYFKDIDFDKATGVLSISLNQDCYKGMGYGTAVIKKMIEYGIIELGLTKIYADVVLRNTRSQHVLEKLGFKYISEDNDLKYFEYIRS